MSRRVLYLDPYHTASHRSLAVTLAERSRHEVTLLTLPARKWKWRMRGAALAFEPAIRALPRLPEIVVTTDFMNLPELLGLTRDLWGAPVPVILYFHENQLTYPASSADIRDIHFGLVNIHSALCADSVIFNSSFHRDEFLDAAEALVGLMPDHRPAGIAQRIRERSTVLGLPLDLEEMERVRSAVRLDEPAGGAPAFRGGMKAPGPAGSGHRGDTTGPGPVGGGHRGAPDSRHDHGDRRDHAGRSAPGQRPIVVWNHRWEEDRNPAGFFAAMEALDVLARDGRAPDFALAVAGQTYRSRPAIFDEARARLAGRIVHWGWIDSRREYLELLGRSRVAVSTSLHEFFGVSVMEAIAMGCAPVMPRRLTYPEIACGREELLYDEPAEIPGKVAALLAPARDRLHAARQDALLAPLRERLALHAAPRVIARWDELIEELAGRGARHG